MPERVVAHIHGLSVESWIMNAACAAPFGYRAPAGKTCRSADLHRARLSRGESGAPSANEHPPESFQENWLRRKDVNLLGINTLRPIREGSGFTSASLRNSLRLRDAGVLPVPTTSQPQRIRLRRCPMGSNAQVPANWAFLQIPAQSRLSTRSARVC